MSPLPSEGEYYINFDIAPKLTPREQSIVAFTRNVVFLNDRNFVDKTNFPKFKYGAKATTIDSFESASKIDKIVASGKNHFGNTEITRKSIAEEVSLTETFTSTSTDENLVEGTASVEVSGKVKLPLANSKVAYSIK
ncbi:hypothetical protein OB981_29970 [Bacillus cereus]|nr:hypothetical protein [Bacillus cereus]